MEAVDIVSLTCTSKHPPHAMILTGKTDGILAYCPKCGVYVAAEPSAAPSSRTATDPADDTILDSPNCGMTRHSAPGPRVNDPRRRPEGT